MPAFPQLTQYIHFHCSALMTRPSSHSSTVLTARATIAATWSWPLLPALAPPLCVCLQLALPLQAGTYSWLLKLSVCILFAPAATTVCPGSYLLDLEVLHKPLKPLQIPCSSCKGLCNQQYCRPQHTEPLSHHHVWFQSHCTPLHLASFPTRMCAPPSAKVFLYMIQSIQCLSKCTDTYTTGIWKKHQNITSPKKNSVN